MDIVGAISGAPIADLAILFGLALLVIAGVLQGSIRRGIGIASMFVAFLFAANLRDSLGNFLNDNWRQFGLEYNRLLAFTILFVVLSAVATVATQGFYHRMDISARHPIVDDIVGGVAGLLQGLLVLVIAVIILNSFILPPAKSGDLSQFRSLQDFVVNQSHICQWLHDNVAPIFVHLFSPLLPADLTSLYP